MLARFQDGGDEGCGDEQEVGGFFEDGEGDAGGDLRQQIQVPFGEREHFQLAYGEVGEHVPAVEGIERQGGRGGGGDQCGPAGAGHAGGGEPE